MPTQSARPPKELVEQAKKVGARRKKLATGEAGFFMNRAELPPGFRVPPHSQNSPRCVTTH